MLLIALTMLTGCANDHDPIVPEGKPIDELRKEMRQHAKSIFSERISQQPANTREGNRSETCNCSYEILDAYYATPPENAGVDIEFFSTTDCTPNNPFDCSYFSAFYFDPEECVALNLPEYCYDFWQSFPPNGRFQFNCSIPEYSQFDVVLSSAYFSPCPIGDYLYSTIVYRIVCDETCNEYSYPAYSDPDTLVFDPSVYGTVFDPLDWRSVVSLAGCGCEPVTGGSDL